ASGRLSPGAAVATAIVLSVGGMAAAALTDSLPFFITAAGYLILTVAYSFRLKHIVLIDVMALAAGFVLRAVAGAEIIHAEISPWLLVCTILLALFLGLAKRRSELATLTDAAG